MLESIVSLFGSLGWLVIRVILTIASLVCAVLFAIIAFFEATVTLHKVLWLLGAFACIALFVVLVRSREKEDEKPVEDEHDRFS